jgi:Lar family restriction alleviation protein
MVDRAVKYNLKACPFCGGKATMMPYHYGGLFDEMFWVTCEDCEAEIPSYQTEEEAAKAWNRRQNDGGE